MCMQGTNEGCILLERMAKVETKLWCVIALLGALIFILTLVTFKLLDAQIYLMTGEQGLHSISDEAREDLRVIRREAK